jgi:hypothetical protein
MPPSLAAALAAPEMAAEARAVTSSKARAQRGEDPEETESDVGKHARLEAESQADLTKKKDPSSDSPPAPLAPRASTVALRGKSAPPRHWCARGTSRASQGGSGTVPLPWLCFRVAFDLPASTALGPTQVVQAWQGAGDEERGPERDRQPLERIA